MLNQSNDPNDYGGEQTVLLLTGTFSLLSAIATFIVIIRYMRDDSHKPNH